MSHAKITYRQKLERIFYFFPFQLLILHIKKNHLLLLFWIILFGFISHNISAKFGVGDLFLYPEYLGRVNFWSYAIVGFTLGGFVTAFNIYTYIIHAHRFPLIATLSKPFYKFSLNNFIIPVTFIISYFILSFKFQKEQEFETTGRILIHLLGFLVGFIFYIWVSFYYFFKTNKDIYKISGKSEEQLSTELKKKNKSIRQKKDWFDKGAKRKKWRVDTYIMSMSHIGLARKGSHYDSDLLKRVFLQNHVNASIFETILVITFLIIGFFREMDIFQIPAGASGILLFTLFLMILSIFLSWLRGWTFTVLISGFLLFNFVSQQGEFLNFENHVYGLDYKQSDVAYNEVKLDDIYSDPDLIKEDTEYGLQMLENWKVNNTVDGDSISKPKLVFVNSSGGGLRATLWTYSILNELNKRSKGLSWDRNFMITGSSGGMFGAAFYRKEALQKNRIENSFDLLSGDVLNPLLIDIATYDIFIRYQHFEYEGKRYKKDRGHSFEERFNENTLGILDGPMSAYKEAEFNAEMPTIVLSPTIINDGRRLIISNHPASFLNSQNAYNGSTSQHIVENVELNRLLKDNTCENLRFLSALRMGATFPYILPQASLPTDPQIRIMDSGIRDNFGFKTTFQYLYSFQDWVEENTSGVVIIQIRDNLKKSNKLAGKDNSVINRLTSPVGNVYGNFTQVHDYTHDQMLQYMNNSFDVPVKEFIIEMDSRDRNISMSWHLTGREKKQVLDFLEEPQIQEQMDTIIKEIR